MNPRVSVIMPSLNVGQYIETALKSVCEQSLNDIEIISIDAGSTDGTWEIIKKCAEKDKRIIAISSDKRSYGYQVNEGIRLAKGEYIGIVETDDYVASNMYENLYNIASQYNLDIVKSDYCAYRTGKDGEKIFIKRKAIPDDINYGDIVAPWKDEAIATEDWYLWNAIYKRQFLKDNGICLSETPGAAYQDIGFVIDTLKNARRCMYIPGEYYFYCIDREGASANSNKDLLYNYTEYKRALEKENDFDASMYKRMAKSFVMSCRKCIGNAESDFAWINEYDWFKRILTDAFSCGNLKLEDIHKEIRDDLSLLLDSIEKFMSVKNEGIKAFLEAVGETDQKTIVVFGCGRYGYNAYLAIIELGYKVDFFTDNNESLWGKNIEGIPICPPEELMSIPSGSVCVVANSKHFDDIYNQVAELNYKCRIIGYSNGFTKGMCK